MIRSTCAMLALAVSMAFSTPALSAGPSPEKREAILKLLELTSGDQVGAQVARRVLDAFKQRYTSVPPEFWSQIQAEMPQRPILEQVVGIYDRHFNEADLVELIKFYESPIGRKLRAVLPGLTRDTLAEGQKYGRSLAEQIQRRLREHGYDKG